MQPTLLCLGMLSVFVPYTIASWPLMDGKSWEAGQVSRLECIFPQLKGASDIYATTSGLVLDHVRGWTEWSQIWSSFLLGQPKTLVRDYLAKALLTSGQVRRHNLINAAMAEIIRDHRQKFFALIAANSFRKFEWQNELRVPSLITELVRKGIEQDTQDLSLNKEIARFLTEPDLYVVFSLDSKVESHLMGVWNRRLLEVLESLQTTLVAEEEALK